MASTFTLLVGLALLGLTAARIMARLGVRSPTAFLVGAFVVAHAALLIVALGLSCVRWFTPGVLITALAACCVLTLLFTRGARSGIDWRAPFRSIRGDPLLLVLAVGAALGVAYSVAMGIWVPQVDDDVYTYHLVRAPLWWQHHGITYLHGILDFRNNAYPPGGELGALTTMTLAGNDFFVTLDELLSALLLAVAAAGIARRLGFNVKYEFGAREDPLERHLNTFIETSSAPALLEKPEQPLKVSIAHITAIGSPRRVTSTGRPLRFTLSRTARQVALNFEIAIVSTLSDRAMTPSYHGQ